MGEYNDGVGANNGNIFVVLFAEITDIFMEVQYEKSNKISNGSRHCDCVGGHFRANEHANSKCSQEDSSKKSW